MTSIDPRKVTISDPGFRVSRHVALACQEANLLDVYYTSIFFGKNSVVRRLANRLPGAGATKIQAQISKRSLDDLDPALVTTVPKSEIVGRANTFVGERMFSASRSDLIAEYREAFDRGIADRITGDEGVVYVNESSGYWTLKRSKELGVRSVFEGSCHPDYHSQVMDRECEHFRMKKHVHSSAVHDLSAISLADVIYTQSEFARGTFLDAGIAAERVVSIPLGVDLQLFDYIAKPETVNKERLNLLYVGNLAFHKGTGRLLEGLVTLNDPRVNVRFIGPINDQFRPVWEKLSAKLPGLIQWKPPVPRRDLVEYYRQADALILPSLRDSFGQVVLEAMAVGTPVIVTSSCGAPVRHEVDGLVIPPGDSNAIADAIQRMLESPEDRLRWGRQSADQARMYDWNRFRRAMVSFLARCME